MSQPGPVGAHTLPYLSVSLERAFAGIAASGMTTAGIFPRDVDGPLFPGEPTTAELDRVRRGAADVGLELVSMFGRALDNKTTESVIADLRLAADLGIPHLLSAGPWPKQADGSPKPVMQWYGEVEHFLASVGGAAPTAEALGVTIVLKPHGGATATGRDLRDVLERIGSPAVRACWDAGNIRYYEGLDSEEDLEASGIAPWVSLVSIKDHRGAAGDLDFPIPGEGEVDHVRMYRTLLAAGFSGPSLVERFDQPTPEANDAALITSRANLAAALAAAAEGNPS